MFWCLCVFQTILFLEQLLDFADTAGAMLLTQGIVNIHLLCICLVSVREFIPGRPDFQTFSFAHSRD